MKKTLILAFLLTLLAGATAQATVQDDWNKYSTDLAADFATLSGWWNDQLAPHLGFATASATKMPANVMVLPGFEIGIEGGATVFPFDATGLKNLAYTVYPSGDIDVSGMPTALAFPHLFFHAKIGTVPLPGVGTWDLGLRLGGFSIPTDDKTKDTFAFSNSCWGLEARTEFMKDGLTSPCGLSGNISVNGMKGHLGISNTYNSFEQYTNYPVLGITSYNSVTGTSKMDMDWQSVTLSVGAIVSKKLVIFNPFGGLALDLGGGTMTTKMSTGGSTTFWSTSPGSAITQAFDITGKKETNMPAAQIRAIVGFELLFLSTYLETNFKDIAATGGLRFQL